MWRAFNPQSCLLLVAVASAAPTGDEAGHLSEVRQWEPSVATESKSSVVKRSSRTVNSYQEIPTTTFSCAAQESAGIFADQETGCQVFHYCQPGGRVDSFFCPNLTLFNQQYFVCDWEYNVDCSLASKYFPLNHQLFASTPSLQIPIPGGIAATSQTDLLGAASSAEASHSLNQIQGVHHAATHTAALHEQTSIVNSNSLGLHGSPFLGVPTHLRAALPAGALGVPAVLDTAALPRVAAVAPIAGSALALGGVSPTVSHPVAQPVFHAALNLATGSLLHPADGATSAQLSRVGKTSPDKGSSSPDSYDDAVADPEPSAPAYTSPSLAPTPVSPPLPTYSSDPYDDAVADPEPYPGATPEALEAAGLPLPYPSTARAGTQPAAVVASSSVSAYDDAVADPEPYPGATPAALLAQGLPLPYKPPYSAPVAYDSADPEPAAQDNPKTTSTQYSPAPSAKYSQYKAARQFDSADPEPAAAAAAAYLSSNTIDLTSSSDFDDSPADPEPDPSSYAVAPDAYSSSFHPDPDSEPSADPEFTSY